MGKLLVRNFPDEKNSSSSPVWGVSSLRMWKSSNGEKIGWEMLLIKISLWGQWQIIILNGKNDVSKGNATKGREAVLPLLVYILQPHNKFHLIFLISTLKYFLEMVHGPPGIFSSAPFFSFLHAHQNVADARAPLVPVFCSVFSKRYYDWFILIFYYWYSNVDAAGRLIKATWKQEVYAKVAYTIPR